MLVPEAAVNQYDLAARRENNIWAARQILAVKPESVPEPVNQTTQNNFRTSVLAADARHICAAAPLTDFVHQNTKLALGYAVELRQSLAIGAVHIYLILPSRREPRQAAISAATA
jgi:hypothetical protein